MIELARSLGASTNYAGSGGAIVGTLPAGPAAADLRAGLEREACHVLVPLPGNAANTAS